MTEKIWKIVTYPEIRSNMYAVSEDGEVRNIIRDKIISPYEDKDGYYKCGLCAKVVGTYKNVFIHRLVAWEFVPNPDNNPVVDHLDGNKKENHYTNLEWVSVKENTNRAEKLGLRVVRGERNGHSKYTEEYITSVCERYQLGASVKDVLRNDTKDPRATQHKYPALYTLLYNLKTKKIWPDVVSKYTYSTDGKSKNAYNPPVPQSSNYTYSEKTIREICEHLQNEKTILDIIEIMTGTREVSSNKRLYEFINDIRTGRRWKEISSEYKIDLEKTVDRYSGWDADIPDLVDAGYKLRDIIRHYGLQFRKDDHFKYDHIARMVQRYKKIKKIPKNSTIIIHD